MFETHYFLITLQHFTIAYNAEYIYVCCIRKVETLYNGESLYACMLSHFSCVWFFANVCTVARQAPLSMGVSRQEYWSGLPFPSPGIFQCRSCIPCNSCLASRFFTAEPLRKAQALICLYPNLCSVMSPWCLELGHREVIQWKSAGSINWGLI